MEKNRNTWSTLLAVVLAMVVMAGLAVTAFAETVTDPSALENVLNGTQVPSEGVDYDVDGNGIVEWDDLKALKGEQVDLLPNGQTDMISWPLDEEWTEPAERDVLQSLFVRGDSTIAIKYDTADQNELLDWPDPYVDFSNSAALVFDLFWPDEVGSLTLTIIGDDEFRLDVPVAKKGWSTVTVDLTGLPADQVTAVSGVYFNRAVAGEKQVVYIDNMYLASGTSVNFSSRYGTFAPKQVVEGATYGVLPAPAQNFYAFEGWYLDEDYTQKVTEDTIVKNGESHTLYAKWSEVVSEDGSVLVSHKGNNAYGITLGHDGYKQMRFNFKVAEMDGTFALSYADGDDIAYNNSFIVILDEKNQSVRFADVEEGKWYTAVVYGTEDQYQTTGNYWYSGNIVKDFTLTVAPGVQMEITNLEALGGKLGYRLAAFESCSICHQYWNKAEVEGYGYVFDFHMADPHTHEHTGIVMDKIVAGQYTKFTYDFCIYERIDANGNAVAEGQAAGFHYASWASWNPTFYDMDGNQVNAKDMKVGSWYKAVVDLTGKSGQIGAYSFNGDTFNTSGSYKAYFANLNWEPAETGSIINDIGTATNVKLTKGSTDGTFWTEMLSRDLARGVYKVSGSSNWAKRTLKIALTDTTKEFIQVDFRFLSAEANGVAVAPTMVASTTVSGAITAAQYVIVDENDDPATTLEIGKWYRMFITAKGASEFALVPMGDASGVSFELQVRNLRSYNADELNVTISGMSLALTKFGELEYAHTGNGTFTAKLNSAEYKQIRFNAKLAKANGFDLAVSGAKVSITHNSGDWYTVVITKEDGSALGNSLSLTISGNTGLRIKDLEAYTTVEAPVSNPSSQYRGLEADEMILLGFLGPRDSYLSVGGAYLPNTIRDEVFKNLAAAGINYLSDNNQTYSHSSEESSKEVLRLAAKYGINYYMPAYDVVQIGSVVGTDGNKSVYENKIASTDAILAKLKEMYQYESFGGLYLRDEPTSALFDEIRTVVETIDSVKDQIADDAVLNYYVNMYPDMGSSGALNNYTAHVDKNGNTIGNLNWDSYLKHGITDTGMNYVSTDIYPFGTDSTSTSFLNYLGRINKVAQDNNVPWMGAAQVGGGKPAFIDNREPTEAELTWDVNAMLAFGAKGVFYYVAVAPSYFNTAEDGLASGMTMININGETTKYYDYVAKINHQIKAIDHVLMNSTHLGVIVNGSGIMGYNENTGKTNLLSTTAEKKSVKISGVSGTALIGAFDYNGQTALLVVNNDVTKTSPITLTFIDGYAYEIIQDGMTSWQTGTMATLSLKAGTCALVVVHNSDDVTPEISLVFEGNYEGSDVPSVVSIPWSENAQYPELPVMQRNGYIFDGWYLDAECTGTSVAAGQTLAINGSHILYAKWTPDTLADILVTGDTELGTPVWQYTDADGWHWYVPNKGSAAAAEHREIYVTMPKDGMKHLSYEIKFNDLSGVTTGLMGLMQGVNKYYDLETGALVGSQNSASLEVGKWYRVEYSTNESKNMGTTPWCLGYPGGFSGNGNISISIRNMKASADPIYSVYFNKNYAGAEGIIDSIVRNSGEAYGQLPELEDRGDYEFQGWFTDAACTNKVTETTAVTSTHVLYAGWNFPDESPVKVHNPAPYQWSLGTELVDGKPLYTYTTRGAVSPATSAWARRLNLVFSAGEQTHLIFEVRFTEAYKADGVTPIDPSLGIYCNNEGNGGNWISTVDFYDSTGKRVKGNEATALQTGEWYTVVVGVKSATEHLELWTAHNYTEDAAVLTMEIRDRFIYDGSNDAATLSTPWDVTPEPALSIVNDEVMYVIWAKDIAQGAYYRAFRAKMKQDGMGELSFEYMMTNVNGGASVGITGVKTYDLTTGELVANPQPDTWYKAVYATGKNLGVGNLELGHLGGDSATPGGMDMYIRNIRATELVNYTVSFDLNYEGATGTPAAFDVAFDTPYGTLPTPTRQYHTFEGWYTEAACTNKISADTVVSSSHTLYAKWTMDTNAIGYSFSTSNGGYYSKVSAVEMNGEFAFKCAVDHRGDNTNQIDRRIHLNIANASGNVVSMKVMITETSGTPAIVIGNASTSNVVSSVMLDEAGNTVDSADMQLNKWYTIMWSADGSAHYQIQPFGGSKVTGIFYMKDIKVQNMADLYEYTFTDSYYVSTGLAIEDGEFAFKVTVNSKGDNTNSWHRLIQVNLAAESGEIVSMKVKVTAPEGNALMTIHNGSGTALTTVIFKDENDNVVNSADLVTGKWYTLSWTADGSSSYQIRPFDGGGINGTIYIKDVSVEKPDQYAVQFNMNYAGATGTPATLMVAVGQPYGALPAPTREGYTFSGWMLENGTVVNADTKVTATHTLYAKWELMPDPNSVAVGYVTDGTKTVDIVDGQYVYTYTTAGKTTHGGNPKRKVNISYPTGQDYIYVEFRFTESKTAAGADLAPYLRVYDPSNSGNGGAVIETIWIYNSKGKQVAKNNSETGLALNEWHTLVVKVKGGTNINMCALSHYATDVPLVTMEIRERNCVDDNSSVVIQNNADYNAASASMTHSLVDGKSFFTYTTRGVSSPTTSPGNRRVEVYFPANQQTHVAVEFRYTEAFAADGVTPIAPTLRVYDKNNGGNGGTYISTVEIFDENGNSVASANALNSLTVGEWYTLVVGLKTNAANIRLWPCPGYTTDAAILTMEFRDWHAYTDPSSDTVGIKKAGGTYENIFPKTDGSVVYKTYPVAANTSAYNRRFTITNSADAALVKFDFVFDVCEDANGSPVTPNLYVQYDNPTDKGNYVVTDANGDPVLDLVVGEKYTMWITTYGNTSHDINVVGNFASALKAQITITDREVVDVTTGAVTLYNNAENYGPLSLYKVGDEVRYGFSVRTGIQNVPTSNGAYTRRLFIKQAASTYNQISFEFKYTVADKVAADGTVTSGGSMITTGAKYYTLDGTEVSDNFTVGTWYKAVLTTNSTFGASVELYPMGYSERPADGQLNMAVTFRNIQATKPGPKIPALVANAANGLTEVSAASAGIETDQKVWKYVKASGSADGETAAQAVYFSNEDGYDYISFDFCFTACNAAGDSSFVNNLPYMSMKGWYPSGSTIATANYLGLTIVEKATGQAPNVTASYTGDLTWGNVEMNKWYTMKCKVTNLSRLHIVLWTSTTAEMYITNIKGE